MISNGATLLSMICTSDHIIQQLLNVCGTKHAFEKGKKEGK